MMYPSYVKPDLFNLFNDRVRPKRLNLYHGVCCVACGRQYDVNGIRSHTAYQTAVEEWLIQVRREIGKAVRPSETPHLLVIKEGI